jgi:tetratricopeptide (TPR) repeat protein
MLADLISDSTAAGIVRATAIGLLRNFPGSRAQENLRRMIFNPDPLIRFAAAEAHGDLPPDQRVSPLVFLLEDSVRLVRTTAARLLARTPDEVRSSGKAALLETVLREYESTQQISSDHPFANMNLGNLYLEQGEFDKAESAFKNAIRIEPLLAPASVNLADLYRITDRDAEGEKVLRDILELTPGEPAVHHALGLLLVRLDRKEEAMMHIREAANLAPEDPQYSYVYGVALHSAGMTEEATTVLASALQRRPGNADIILALATIHRDQGNIRKALQYAHELARLYPEDQSFAELEHQLRLMIR